MRLAVIVVAGGTDQRRKPHHTPRSEGRWGFLLDQVLITMAGLTGASLVRSSIC